ncbi:unnamed protein product [Rotaria socialis]|uniref:Uncharacterized protein n=1 Tax=Rotaria socialis TaxID=392032 RepID=A0A818E6X9_9BILA|nr:unnamed protein product [Rotaria socialis]CAF4513933.1 unnamed protein product [Rotaria socialis]
MRLKTLRKKRPAFENEGTVVSGSRMDLSNNEIKPFKHRTNTSFALPTSLNNDLSSLSMSVSDRLHDMEVQPSQQTLINQRLNNPAPSQATLTPSYHALEAAYLEHGIRIHLNPTTAATVSQQQSQTNMNTSDRKSASTLHRVKIFINRNPSRSSSALHYPTVVTEPYQDTRPFSALQQTSMTDFEGTDTNNVSGTHKNENQQNSHNQEQLNFNYCASSLLVSEHSQNLISATKVIDNNDASSAATTVLDNDPDIAYMTSLLKTTTGDSYRDTIRRRAGLRPTLAVHRHPESTVTTSTITATTTSTKSKKHEKSSVTQSPTANVRKVSVHHSTVSVMPIASPSKKQVEKDIVRHASRIRASQMKDYFNHQDRPSRSNLSYQFSSMSNSPTRTSYPHTQNKNKKPSKSISLEPLELLLAPTLCSSASSSPRTPARVNALSSHAFSCVHRNNHEEYVKPSKICTKPPKLSFDGSSNSTHYDITTKFSLFEHPDSLSLNDENSPLMKTSILGMISSNNNNTRQSNSSDSGCYDRSSSSGDTHSITSASINHTPCSIPSGRLTSASTRRSNTSKKVSFEDQARTIIVTTAIYV